MRRRDIFDVLGKKGKLLWKAFKKISFLCDKQTKNITPKVCQTLCLNFDDFAYQTINKTNVFKHFYIIIIIKKYCLNLISKFLGIWVGIASVKNYLVSIWHTVMVQIILQMLSNLFIFRKKTSTPFWTRNKYISPETLIYFLFLCCSMFYFFKPFCSQKPYSSEIWWINSV